MKTLEGIVVKTAMQKTATVEVFRITHHSFYNVRMKQSKKYKCDMTETEAFVGDRVRIAEIRPISKDKHFKIVKVLQKAKGEIK